MLNLNAHRGLLNPGLVICLSLAAVYFFPLHVLGADAGEQLIQRGQVRVQPDMLGGESIPLRWQLDRLTSAKGEKEVFERVADPASMNIQVESQTKTLDDNGLLIRLTFTNEGDQRRMLRSSAKLATPSAPKKWWNGNIDRQQNKFDPDDVFLSKWFPLNAALGVGRTGDGRPVGVGLGVHPRDVYSRIESGHTEERGGQALTLAQPFVVDPGQSFDLSYVVTAFGSRFGSRDVIQRYYNLFPEAYAPAPGVDPRVLGPETSYLGWNNGRDKPRRTEAMIRRLTSGKGGWEWCYAPMIRAGDWAISDQWTVGWEESDGKTWKEQNVKSYIGRLHNRLRTVGEVGSAAMYYVNLMYAERSLIDQHFPETVFDRREVTSFGGTPTVISVYPGSNGYGDLFRKSIDLIAEKYPQARGIGWDSAFGHRILTTKVAGVEQAPRRSFKQGKVIAIEGGAHARLLDRNHGHKSDQYRMANTVNLKLVTPYFNHARTDTALYEGAPNARPQRLNRVESMKTRLGSKAIGWHKHLTPSHIDWIEWDRLSNEQIKAAYRQVQQDAVLLSYFWGGYPSPGMPGLGVERVMDAMPKLVSLIEQGWQASPLIETDRSVIIARYGQGVGSRVVLINPTYEPQQVTVLAHASDWSDRAVLLVRADGEPLDSTVTARGAHGKLTVPSHDISVLRVAGAIPVKALQDKPKLKLTSQRRSGDGGLITWAFEAATKMKSDLPITFYRTQDTAHASFVQLGKTSELPANEDQPTLMSHTVDTEPWSVDFQAENAALRRGKFYIDQQPNIALAVTSEQLKQFGFFNSGSDDQAILPVVVDNDSSDASRQAARDLVQWYNATAARHGEKDALPEARILPVRDVEKGGRSIRLKMVSDDSLSPHHARVEIDGKQLRLLAKDDPAMVQTVDQLLTRLDRAYPYYGHLPSDDPYLKKAGLAGKVLHRKPPKHVAGKPLEQWLIQADLMPSATK